MRTATGYGYKNYILLLGLMVILSVFFACNKSTDSTDKPDNPNTGGVLLEGDTNSTAAYATTKLFANADPSVLLEDSTGLMANKLSVVLNPTATIGVVNAALDSIDALIIGMTDTSLFLTLSIPVQPDSAHIDSLCQFLVSSGAFLFAFPAFAPLPPVNEEESANPTLHIIPNNPAAASIAHLKACRMPATWNLMEKADSVKHKVSVLVPDSYASLTTSSEIPSQRFVHIPGDGADIRVQNGQVLGNHGFNVCGVLGAKYDDIGTTGIHPGSANLLEIRSLNIGTEDWGRKMQYMADSISRTTTSIVSTSLGYNDPFFKKVSKWERVQLALKWRELVGGFQEKFLHATSAGNDARRTNGVGSLAVFNSPFTMAAQMNTPWEWLGAGEYTEADSLGYVALQEFYNATKPWLFTPLENIVIVGSSKLSGERSAFSNLGADVRMVGEKILGPCVMDDNFCQNNFVEMTGTSQATPQIAGLAAYLMNLNPDLTAYQAKDIIKNAYDNSVGYVDTYRAALSMDITSSPALRMALLDVAADSSSAGPDGKFDENDLIWFLSAYITLPPTLAQANINALDYSRFDLNGDGQTGGTATAKFNLTMNYPPTFNPVGASFCTEDTVLDENQLTDIAILQYYAYSSLFTGDINKRDSLFQCGDPLGRVVITWRSEMGRTIVESADYDSVLDVAGDSMSNPPPFLGISPSGSSSYPCSGGGEASATVIHSSSFSLSGPDTLLGFTYSASGEAIADGSCDVHPHVTSFVGVSFEVVNAPVYFTLSLNGTWSGDSNCVNNCGSSGNIDYTDTNGEEIEYSFPEDGTTVQDNGVLTPGSYNISVGNSAGRTGSFEMTFSISFSSSAKKKNETNYRSKNSH